MFYSIPIGWVIVGSFVESFGVIGNGAPFPVFGEFRSPILAFAKDFAVKSVVFLQGSVQIDHRPVGAGPFPPGRVSFTLVELGTPRCDAGSQQPLQLPNLIGMDPNRILQNTPMHLFVTGRDSLRSFITIIILKQQQGKKGHSEQNREVWSCIRTKEYCCLTSVLTLRIQ